jgi:glycolate oxidase iron-sulfur subunit
MRTEFTPDQLADPAAAAAEAVIRTCVHCGFCNATCPTHVLLGDELDSPRGRIYLIKDMLENERVPSPEVVKHIDRCLSCLACMTTCPSGVHYMHLVDHARGYIEARYRRPLGERLFRAMLATVLPRPRLFRAALGLARFARPLAGLIARLPALAPIATMLKLAPRRLPPKAAARSTGTPGAKGRVVLLQGCVEPVLAPEYRAASVRLLGRLGYDVVFAAGEQCCGSLVRHMGRDEESLDAARRNVAAWRREIDGEGLALAAIIVTASGCGTTIKDYGFMLRDDPVWAADAARVSALTRDISEFLAETGLPAGDGGGLAVTYHAACSLQHGQKVTDAPKLLLEAAGFAVRTPDEAHLCCGSAGTYNILQPEIAGRLLDRKLANIARTAPAVIATGNIGCATQLARGAAVPVVHIVELLDWATGGPMPAALDDHAR